MKLYHISLGWKEETKIFVPRIPKTTASNEDNCSERICLSDSIDGCLSAIPNKPYRTNMKKKITIYEGEFNEYVDYKELYFSGKVPDAYLTHEYWIQTPIQMTGKHVYLKSFESSYDFVPNEKVYPDFIANTISILRKKKYKETKKLATVLKNSTMVEAMFHILPDIINTYYIDWEDICDELLSVTRLVLNPEITSKEA